MTPLLPLSEALEQLLARVATCPEVEQVSLQAALDRILAEDQHAVIDVPPADNSAMDGYALRARDAGRKLPVSERVAAGDAASTLREDSVARIFTGGEIPAGADAVVMQEDMGLVDGVAELPGEIRAGQHIRRKGQDCRAGSRLLPSGRRLRPQDIGLLASQGIAQVPVFQKLTVALLSTGNELREPGSGALPPGAIFNSNRPMLVGLLSTLGCGVLDLGIVRDTPEATREALLDAAARADVIVSSGGVSVGEADHVRDAVRALGEIDLWRIAIKPGKPFAFGHVAATPFIGLPGNPSSAFVTFLLLARPYLCALQGRREAPPITLRARADFTVASPGSRQEYLRVSLSERDSELWAAPYANQSSGVLSSLSASNALAVVPVGETIENGQWLQVMRLDDMLP
ncbi:molybdopterin molybdotransferase MoeA [Congregibacter litoralis]|uniref:Molybdopterin molybdenumtransferase n=1 Tax=Congregibacter litoralis KT71 TaxID=314285 RepID=A4A653_9GAMM|nr:gephyrin-like molybdotransferase Glp [Congregibacter litoralis]EAQ98500.1 molybdopterin molybdochelatase [Congregibacter litoralis KT71]